MFAVGWAHVVSLFGIVSLLCWTGSAYYVDSNSCGSNVGYVQAAMADAQSMASAGQSAVTATQNGNSRELIWKAGSDYSQVATNLGSMLSSINFSYSKGTSPLIFCGSVNWVQTPGSNRWVNKLAGGLTISTTKPALCGTNNLATTYQNAKLRVNPDKLSSIIILCDAAPGETGQSPDSSGNVATLADVSGQTSAPTDPTKDPGDGQKGFYPGKNMDRIAGYWLTSLVLTHELMHVSPVFITSGKAEVYGWNRCAGKTGQKSGLPGITTFDAALQNGDSYAYYSLSAYVEATSGYDVIDGEMFVPPSIGKLKPRAGFNLSHLPAGNGRPLGERDTFFLWD